jgi:hypothetical protein
MTYVEDILELQRLQALYGHVMDAREWEGLDVIFTEDAIVDFEPFDLPKMEGLEAIRRDFAWIRHPFGHHVTNVVIDVDGDTARMKSKILAVLDDGSAITGVYTDEARRTPDGWRLTYRKGDPFPRRSRPRE